MSKENISGNNEVSDFLNMPYVKVATHELALLVREIQKSQMEKKQMSEYIKHYFTSSNHPEKLPQVVDSQDKNKCSQNMGNLVGRGVRGCESSDNELEVDCAPEFPLPINREYKSAPELTGSKFIYDERSVAMASCENETYPIILSSPTSTLLPKLPSSDSILQPRLNNVDIGVSKNYFDSALEELAKTKELNSHLIRITEQDPSYIMNLVKLQSLYDETVSENRRMRIIIEQQQLYNENPDQLVSDLSKKVSQQERQLSLRNLVCEHLNKQCDMWKGKYKESVEKSNILSKKLASLTDPSKSYCNTGVQTQEESTPKFDALLDNDNNNRTDDEIYKRESYTHDVSLINSEDLDTDEETSVQIIHNLNTENDLLKEQYKVLQEEYQKLNSEHAREKDVQSERMTHLNRQLFSLTIEKNTLQNTLRDASFKRTKRQTEEDKKVTSSMPSTLNTEDNVLLKTIKLISSDKNINRSMAFSELNFNCEESFFKADHVDRIKSQPSSCPIISMFQRTQPSNKNKHETNIYY
ncbi:uncharacterized protein LOC126810807 [Patella vulgata]|uniref:uncharacterized protein LOC126810807 n=1 Tax=Patella vulgata TaxID=6465 RepID=UPI00217FA799|nr:uncharacterized protein LOC126810807 [Patella vulgata]